MATSQDGAASPVEINTEESDLFVDDSRLSLLKPRTYQPPPMLPRTISAPAVPLTAAALDVRSHQRLPSINEIKPVTPPPPPPTTLLGLPTRGAMWPQALRITKLPEQIDTLSLHDEVSPLSSTHSFVRQRNESPARSESSVSRSGATSQASTRMWSPGHSPQSSLSGAESSDSFVTPQSQKSHTASSNGSPRERRRLQRPIQLAHKPRSPNDWKPISPVLDRTTLMKIPTPPASPHTSFVDEYYTASPTVEAAEIVIGRQISMQPLRRSSSVPEEALSPTRSAFIAAFNEKPTTVSVLPTRNFSRHGRSESTTIGVLEGLHPASQLPSQTFPVKRRSLSANEATIDLPESLAAIPSTPYTPSRIYPVDTTNLGSPLLQRAERSRAVAEAITDLNLRASTHFEKYTKLRQSRQILHSEILAILSDTRPRAKGSKTSLQLQIEIATIDAGIDDCVSKLSALEKKRQRQIDELLLLSLSSPASPSPSLPAAPLSARKPSSQISPRTQAAPSSLYPQARHIRTDSACTTTTTLSHSRNVSVGIQEIIASPRTPRSPMMHFHQQAATATQHPIPPPPPPPPPPQPQYQAQHHYRDGMSAYSPSTRHPAPRMGIAAAANVIIASDRFSKKLPEAPGKVDLRSSTQSLSLANIMDFLDTPDACAY